MARNFGKNNEGQYDERIMGYFAHELTSYLKVTNFQSFYFAATFDVNAPNIAQREQILKWILEARNRKIDTDLNEIANKTPVNELTPEIEQGIVSEDNFTKALEYMQSNYNESIGAPKVPKVQWADVGGLDDVKEEIIKTITLSFKAS
ncbi:hypothetical protein NQ317_017745 [Molorchus minor]|uniref:Uncharacterized protein n=1 Tax=Molorchus minor TaxID=1323400 RepID=A0ABQ9J0D3_9CUCU|nr:hypothetical protein NQ317_017745 [Molorchus minor]